MEWGWKSVVVNARFLVEVISTRMKVSGEIGDDFLFEGR